MYVVRETNVIGRPRDEMDWYTVCSFNTADEAKAFAEKRSADYLARGFTRFEVRVERW